MHPSFSPPIRRRRLARIFRNLRWKSGKTLATVSEETGVPRATLGKLETAELRRIRDDQLTALAELYGLDAPTLAKARQLTRDGAEHGWWVKYKDLYGRGDLPSFEAEACAVRVYECQVVPGLLQTPEYMRATLVCEGSFTENEIARHVEGRRERQRILAREDPPQITAVLDEAVLRRAAGGPEVMREQLHHLLHLARRPRVSIHVLPFATGMHGANLGSFQLMDFTDPADPSLGFSETPTAPVLAEKPVSVRRMDSMWCRLRSAALPADRSLAFLATVVEELGGLPQAHPGSADPP